MRMRCIVSSLAIALLVAAPVSAELPADVDAITKHLEFFGYKVANKGDHLEAEHPQNVNFNVRAIRGGTIFITYFPTEDDAKKPENRQSVLELINGFNENSVLVNFFIDKDGDLGASAWYPGPYQKEVFGLLVDRWNSDVKENLQRDPEKSKALLR